NAVYFQRPDGQGVLGTDGRYATQVEIETGQPEDIELLIENKLLEQVPEQAQVTGFAVESSLSIGEAKKLAADGPLPEVTTGLVEELRLVKDSQEIAAWRQPENSRTRCGRNSSTTAVFAKAAPRSKPQQTWNTACARPVRKR